MLSVSAIHLALLEPGNISQYRLRALHHHDLGVRLFNQQLSNITSENSQVLFPFAVMLVIWGHAAPIITEDDLELDEIFSLLELVRGCKTIFMLHWDRNKNTPLGAITDFLPRPKSRLSSVALRAFENLRLRIPDAIYINAMERLEKGIMKAAGMPDDIRTVVAWLCLIDEEVWNRLRGNDIWALFLLAHYAMLLERYEGQWWWISGWSRRILSAVELVLSVTDKETLGWNTFLSHVEDHRGLINTTVREQ